MKMKRNQIDSKLQPPFDTLSGDKTTLYWENINGLVKSAHLNTPEADSLLTDWNNYRHGDLRMVEVLHMVNRVGFPY
jgi:hypothetical protein